MTVTTVDNDILTKIRTLYGRARQDRRTRLRSWTRNYSLLRNAIGGSPVADWIPSPKDPEIYPICSAMVGWVVDQHTNIEINPAASPHTPFADYMGQVSQDLETILKTNHEVNDHDAAIALASWDNLLYGVGLFKSVWDQSLDRGYGNATMRRVDPWRFLIDPNAHDLHDAEYMIEVSELSRDEIERRWPEAAHKLADIKSGGTIGELDRKPDYGNMSQSSGPQMAPDTTKMGGDGQIAYSMNSDRSSKRQQLVRVYECWLAENDEWYDEPEDLHRPDAPPAYSDKHVAKRWRVVVVANSQVLMDEYADDLFSNGLHPYSRFAFDDIGEFYGLPMVDFLAQPQLYINRLLTALQFNAELTGNPIMLRSTASGMERVNIANRPGAVYPVNQAAMQGGGAGVQWMRPPEPSAIMMDLIRFYIDRMENISGLTSAVKGQGGGKQQGDRTSADARGMAQEVSFVRVRAGISRLEQAMEDAYRKQADLIIDNYTDPRYMAIIGPDGVKTGLALRYRHFMVPTNKGATPLQYQLGIDAGSDAPTSGQSRRTQELQLFTLGATDDQALLQAVNYPGWQELLQRKYKKQQEGLQYGPGSARQRRNTGGATSSRSQNRGDAQIGSS